MNATVPIATAPKRLLAIPVRQFAHITPEYVAS